jgi:predicted permease
MQAAIPQIVYAVWCVFWAYANYRAIDHANERILHGINGLCHLSICIYFGIVIHWMIGLAMFFSSRAIFDTFLNLFRMGWRNIGYVPKNPKSIADKLEKKVFGKKGILPKVIYLIIAIILTIYYHKP